MGLIMENFDNGHEDWSPSKTKWVVHIGGWVKYLFQSSIVWNAADKDPGV